MEQGQDTSVKTLNPLFLVIRPPYLYYISRGVASPLSLVIRPPYLYYTGRGVASMGHGGGDWGL